MRGALGAASGCPAGSPEGAALAFWSWWTAAPSSAEEPKALLMAGSGAGTAVALLRRASEASVAPRFPAVAELCSASSAERVLAAVGQGGVKTLLKDQLGPTSVAPLSLALPQASKSFEGPEQFRPSPALSSSFSGRRPARRLVVLVDDLSLPMRQPQTNKKKRNNMSAVIKLYNSRLLGTPNTTTTMKQQQQEQKLFVPCSNEVYDLAHMACSIE
ncbi:unnamed protein product, partial [Polarella glacialis]